MSTELTFRQKLIRVASSAAICGLSFSFILGEAVDSQATQLRAWASDPKLLPDQYLPLRPLAAALEQIDNEGWKTNFIAANSQPTQAIPGIALEPLRKTAPILAQSSSLYKEPALVLVTAAPAKESRPSREMDTQLPSREVETILASIHQAEASLASTKIKVSPQESATVSQATEPKGIVIAEPAPPALPQTKPLTERLVAARSAKGREVRGWSLSGRILGSTAQNMGSGHFEVGLYTKVDPDGKPVGFPITQQILPAGRFSFKLEVPGSVERGYLFADFVAKGGKHTLLTANVNPWQRDMGQQLAELFFHAEDSVSAVAAASLKDIAKDRWMVKGNVSTMFAQDVPQADVVVKVRGRKEAARTDAKGNFSIDLPKLKGTLFLEVLKAGYHPSIVGISSGDERFVRVEIASRHAIDQISQRLGSIQGSSQGILIGQIQSTGGAGQRGASVQLSLKSDGPFYFDEDGVVTRDLKATAANGRFLFLNVEPGTGYLETSLNGESIAPVQVSSVEGGELIQKSLVPTSGSIRGRIFNPVAPDGKMAPVAGARIRIEGASEWVSSDAFGAFSLGPLKWMKGEKLSLEVSAEKFNNHRYLIEADQAAGLNLFAFPAQYIARLARSMDVDLDAYSGVVIGKVTGPSLRIDALADHSPVNNAKDYYFDSRGKLRGSHEMTDSRFGTYIIFNVPKGRVILQGNDSSGALRYSEAIFASSSSINVEME